jgi:hypothetical protein
MTNSKLTKNKNIKTSKKSLKVNKLKGGGGSAEDYIYKSKYVSSQQNQDINYKEIGIIHITESGAINFLKGFASGVANIFGGKGFDNSVYDRTRNLALNKIMRYLDTETQKICNLRMDVENNPQSSSFFIHLYGTLLERKK